MPGPLRGALGSGAASRDQARALELSRGEVAKYIIVHLGHVNIYAWMIIRIQTHMCIYIYYIHGSELFEGSATEPGRTLVTDVCTRPDG